MSISDDIIEEFYDILSSGYGPELTEFHKTELTNFINPLSKEVKKELWEDYSNNTDDMDEYEVSQEERDFVKKVCEID